MRLGHRVWRQLSLLSIAALALQCTESIDGGSCAEDSDCAAGLTCLVDLDRSTSYCVAACVGDSDCPAHQDCRVAQPARLDPAGLRIQICVDKVRACSEAEACNGLDDDCDGVVDGAACTVVDRCLDDEPCGAWVCQAPENQPKTLCVPPVDGGGRDYESCDADGDCFNGVCETGFCSSFCRPDRGCPSLFIEGEDREMLCARSVGLESRPLHNKCQMGCGTDRDCVNGLSCVWRDIFDGNDEDRPGILHQFVCAQLDPMKTPLGGACSNNIADEGDAECQHGLCYGRICTQSCGGFGADCSDLGANFSCRQIELLYGGLPFGAFICVEDGN